MNDSLPESAYRQRQTRVDQFNRRDFGPSKIMRLTNRISSHGDETYRKVQLSPFIYAYQPNFLAGNTLGKSVWAAWVNKNLMTLGLGGLSCTVVLTTREENAKKKHRIHHLKRHRFI
jgi:hypothetical protein